MVLFYLFKHCAFQYVPYEAFLLSLFSGLFCFVFRYAGGYFAFWDRVFLECGICTTPHFFFFTDRHSITLSLCSIHGVTFLLQCLVVILYIVPLNIMPLGRSVRRKADSNSHQPPPRRVVQRKLSFCEPTLPYISSGLPKRKCTKASFDLGVL